MPPLIKRPRGIPGWQLGLGVGVGIIGGIYIWKPMFEKFIGLQSTQTKENAIEK